MALAAGDFPVNLGLLSFRPSVVATDVGFEAVNLCPGAIERVTHPSERLMARPQLRARQTIACLVEPLVTLVGKAVSLVGTPVACVGDVLTRIGKRFALVRDAVSVVRAPLLLA